MIIQVLVVSMSSIVYVFESFGAMHAWSYDLNLLQVSAKH